MERPQSDRSTTVPSSDAAEDRRLRTLEHYDVLDAPPTEALDRVTRLATTLFDVPVALVNVIDRNHQHCVSAQGWALDQTDREVSFCNYTIRQDGVMVVQDTREEERFADHPLVTGEPHIRFYAGAPLTAPNGYRLGTLCLIDDAPRAFSSEQRNLLADLAGVVMDELNLRHHASDLAASRRAHREASEQRKRILESITDAFVAVDENWLFTYVNAQAEALLERSRDELLGASMWDAFPEIAGSTFQKKYKTAIEERTTVEFVEYYPPLNRWFEVKAFPFEGGLSVYFDDVSDRMEARERLRRERDLTEAIMNTSVTALLTVDQQGRYSFANEPARTILDLDPGALEGRRVDELGTLYTLDGQEVPEAEWPFARVLRKGTPITDERYVLERPDGERRTIRVNGAPLHDPDGTVRQVVFSVDDVTDQVEYERKLKRAKEEAEQASRLKSAFLANMSHDVRTPLSSILNLTELLAREAPPECKERIELIERSSYRLLNTIDSVLDLAKLETGAVAPDRESVDLVDELLGTAEMFQPQADEHDLTLRTEVQEPMTARLDPSMLHRILDNLISNALKFTEAGGTVTLRARGTDDTVTIEVEDTGPGIPEAFLPNLFESFARGAHQTAVEGSGLGLAITKRLTELLGGTVDVDSEVGVGTTFTVRLPRA
ncbi:MAG: PAS domain-containing protein [Salinibacter sp.]